MKKTALALLIAAVATGSGFAQTLHAKDFVKQLHFAPGKSSAVASNDIVRDDADIYFVRAKAGQVMTINVTSLEDNAAIDVYEPKVKGSKEAKNISGGSDLTKWSGTLAKTGDYKIEVSGTRGNTSYKLQVTVK